MPLEENEAQLATRTRLQHRQDHAAIHAAVNDFESGSPSGGPFAELDDFQTHVNNSSIHGGGSGAHPDLTAHDALGLATQTELDTHANNSSLHGGSHPNLAAHDSLGLATQAELDAHAAAADPHTGYQRESEKDQANGYVGLDSGTKVPTNKLGTGTADNTVFLRGDRTWATPAGGGSHPDLAAHDTLGLATQAELDAHAAAADPHTGYQRESEKDAANGYPGLDANLRIATARLGSGTANGSAVLRGDQTWGVYDLVQNHSLQGIVAVQAGTLRWRPPLACTILGVSASIGTAPTGTGVIIDVNKNGTTIFTTQANRPTISASNNATASESTPNVTNMSVGDYLTVDIDQVGSTAAGSDLTVFVRYRWT